MKTTSGCVVVGIATFVEVAMLEGVHSGARGFGGFREATLAQATTKKPPQMPPEVIFYM